MPPRPPMAAPGNLGAVTAPQINQGNVAAAGDKLTAALRLIQQALPDLPLGSPLQEQVSKIATNLAKHLTDHAENIANQRQTLIQAARGMQNQAQMSALSRLAPPQPNTPPAMMAPPGPAGGGEGGGPPPGM